MSMYKQKMFDLSEERINQKITHLRHGLVTVDEVLSDLHDDIVVSSMWSLFEVEKIIGFELRQGETVQ
jgi:hypothetical protein|tara:strand:+ start:2447 stop:2650 length:204 start_codon:yes stop_codon:yes gene_type:complete